jgi:ribosomal protein L37AE/L43A
MIDRYQYPRGRSVVECAWCPLPAEPGTALCADCLAASAADIAALPADWAALGALVPWQGGPQQRVSGTRAPSVPLDLLADELARSIVWTLGVWEPPVREACRLPAAPEKCRPDVIVDRAASLLSWRLNDFAALGDTWGYPEGLSRGCVARRGLYGVSSLRRLHQRAGYALGDVFPTFALPGLCALCGAAALARQSGSDIVACRHCGHQVAAGDYRTMLGLAAE